MLHKLNRKISFGLTLAVLVAMILTSFALADDISNSLDTSVDAVAEVMPLISGGANGTTQLYVVPRNEDGKNGCNLTGSTTLVVSVSSSDAAVATVSPASVTFTSCGDTPTLTVTPISQGSTKISVSLISNSTAGSFNFAPATFLVNVAPPQPTNTPPKVSVAGVTGGASYNKGSVPAATCQVTDSEDGNSSFSASLSAVTGPYASDGIGQQTATCSYTDAGGLTAVASETYNIVDPSAPVISYTLSPASPDGLNGWYKSSVALTWTVTENESPNSLEQTGCVDQLITVDQDTTEYTCSATSAGGSSGPVSVSVKRDATAPSITGSRSPAANANGWNNSDVSVSFVCNDNLSGVASCGPDQVLSSEGADQSVTGTVVDNAGNSASTTVIGIKIDKTAPAVSVTGVADGATYTLGAVPEAGCSTTDALSGVANHASLSVTGGPVGSVTATCTGAQDNAGNQGSDSVTYSIIYDWTGFFQPVDNDILNVAKAGSAIPVKFSLSGYQGLDIFTAGFPKSQKVDCDSTGTSDIIEETVTAGSSGLKYDAAEDQYSYVWKTDKSWAGTCREFSLKLIDGTPHTFKVNFKK